jgi:S1-C subfamily serine protease
MIFPGRISIIHLCAALLLWCGPSHAATGKKMSFSVGTGFYVSQDGYLLTARHVVDGCSGPISVHGRLVVLKAKLVAADPVHDIALLKIIPSFAIPHVASFRSAQSPLKLGEAVVVTGYPSESMDGEFVEFITSSAKITNIKSIRGDNSQFMFTYAAKSGYSGGPVLDAAGNVIGLTSSATCVNSACMDGFKKAFGLRAQSVEQVNDLEETISRYVDTNIGVSLPVIQAFLKANKVPYIETRGGNKPSSERISEIAQSIANVRCPSEERTLIENSGVIRLK